MKKDHKEEIIRELEDLSSSLSQYKRPIEGNWPKAYFDDFADVVIAAAKSAEYGDLQQSSVKSKLLVLSRPQILSIAATLLLLVFALGFIFLNQNSIKSENLVYDEMIDYMMDDLEGIDIEYLYDLQEETNAVASETFYLEKEAVFQYLEQNLEELDLSYEISYE